MPTFRPPPPTSQELLDEVLDEKVNGNRPKATAQRYAAVCLRLLLSCCFCFFFVGLLPLLGWCFLHPHPVLAEAAAFPYAIPVLARPLSHTVASEPPVNVYGYTGDDAGSNSGADASTGPAGATQAVGENTAASHNSDATGVGGNFSPLLCTLLVVLLPSIRMPSSTSLDSVPARGLCWRSENILEYSPCAHARDGVPLDTTISTASSHGGGLGRAARVERNPRLRCLYVMTRAEVDARGCECGMPSLWPQHRRCAASFVVGGFGSRGATNQLRSCSLHSALGRHSLLPLLAWEPLLLVAPICGPFMMLSLSTLLVVRSGGECLACCSYQRLHTKKDHASHDPCTLGCSSSHVDSWAR